MISPFNLRKVKWLARITQLVNDGTRIQTLDFRSPLFQDFVPSENKIICSWNSGRVRVESSKGASQGQAGLGILVVFVSPDREEW